MCYESEMLKVLYLYILDFFYIGICRNKGNIFYIVFLEFL